MIGPLRRGRVYGDVSAPLDPHRIRTRRFRVRRWRQGGLDPVEVYAFLYRIAEELALRQRELRAAQVENERIKGVLRHWQTWHRRCAIPGQRWPSRLESGEQS